MDQIVQIAGSLVILTAFIAAQRRTLATTSPLYLSLNLVGASILTVRQLPNDDHPYGREKADPDASQYQRRRSDDA